MVQVDLGFNLSKDFSRTEGSSRCFPAVWSGLPVTTCENLRLGISLIVPTLPKVLFTRLDVKLFFLNMEIILL